MTKDRHQQATYIIKLWCNVVVSLLTRKQENKRAVPEVNFKVKVVLFLFVFLTKLTKIIATHSKRSPLVARNPPVGNHWFD